MVRDVEDEAVGEAGANLLAHGEARLGHVPEVAAEAEFLHLQKGR